MRSDDVTNPIENAVADAGRQQMTKQSFAKASKRRTVRGPARLRMATVATAIALASLSACAAKDSPEALLDKARQENIDNEWVVRARDAITGNVPTTPPPPPGGSTQ